MCSRLARFFERGASLRNLARLLQEPQSRLRYALAEWRRTGEVRPDGFEEDWEAEEKEAAKRAVAEIVESNCALTLAGMKAALERVGIRKEVSAIQRCLRELNFTKKRLRRVPLERNSARRLLYRQKYCQMIVQVPLPQLVFMDETAFSQQTALSYGWAPKGQEPFVHVSAHRKQAVSLIAAVSQRGFEATRLVRGPVTHRHVCEFLEHHLDHLRPAQVLVMDNARVHHAAPVKEKILQLKLVVRYLPAYTPQLNPIEHVFAEIKAHFIRRRAKGELRVAEIEALVEESIQAMRSSSFERHFAHYLEWVKKGLSGDLFI